MPRTHFNERDQLRQGLLRVGRELVLHLNTTLVFRPRFSFILSHHRPSGRGGDIGDGVGMRHGGCKEMGKGARLELLPLAVTPHLPADDNSREAGRQ